LKLEMLKFFCVGYCVVVSPPTHNCCCCDDNPNHIEENESSGYNCGKDCKHLAFIEDDA